MVGISTAWDSAFAENDIIKERDPEDRKRLGYPEEYLEGHGWHTYSLDSEDKTSSSNLPTTSTVEMSMPREPLTP